MKNKKEKKTLWFNPEDCGKWSDLLEYDSKTTKIFRTYFPNFHRPYRFVYADKETLKSFGWVKIGRCD